MDTARSRSRSATGIRPLRTLSTALVIPASSMGGTGDGASYTGTVQVTGSDPYGLDSDGDALRP